MCSVGPRDCQSHPTAARLGQDPKQAEFVCKSKGKNSPKPPPQLFISLLWMDFSSQTAAGAVGQAKDEEQGKACSGDLLQVNNARNKPKIILAQLWLAPLFISKRRTIPA